MGDGYIHTALMINRGTGYMRNCGIPIIIHGGIIQITKIDFAQQKKMELAKDIDILQVMAKKEITIDGAKYLYIDISYDNSYPEELKNGMNVYDGYFVWSSDDGEKLLFPA